MTTYELTPEGKQDLKGSLSGILIIPLAVVVAAAFTLLVIYGVSPVQIAGFGIFFLAFIVVAAWVGARSTYKSECSLKITFDDDRLIQDKLNKPQRIIRREEVKQIIQIGNEGLRVDSNISGDSIVVPKELTGFEELKGKLSSWATIDEPGKKEFLYPFIAIYGLLAVVIAAIFLKSRLFWIIISGTIVIFMIFAFVQGMIQKMRSSKGFSKWMPIIVPILIALFVYVLVKYMR